MGDLSKHFSRIEFTCRCGCGTYIPSPRLVEMLEKFRAFCCKEIGKDVRFISHCGLRCAEHNRKKNGVIKSRHLPRFFRDDRGAFDFHSPDISNRKLRKLARKARNKKILFGGVGYYFWGVHCDSDYKFPRRWGLWI